MRATVAIVALLLGIAALPASADTLPRATTPDAASRRCDWPMWGRDPARTFDTTCTTIDPSNVADLQRIWFFNTHDVVTATPAVVGDSVYVGDWSGRFYALRRSDGTKRWVVKTKPHPRMYAGQIVSSAAVARVAGRRTVFFGGGKTLYALNASDGSLRWKHELGRRGDGDDPTEIESSPVVIGNTVIVGWDVHNSPAGEPAGVLALDARTGAVKWRTVTAPTEDSAPGADDATGSGCGDVWSSPTVDVERRLVFVGTGNCVTSPKGWGRFAEAVVAMDLDDGTVQWTYQPHEPNRNDLDFAGAPNLFESAGQDLVGLGGKDGTYYALDRETGALVWSAPVVAPGLTEPGSNFSTGGFIGPTAVANGIITGGTAIGGAPYLHGLDTTTGAVAWQQPIAAPTYGAPAVATNSTSGVVIIGGTDFTMRALELATGSVLWEDEVSGAVSGGPAIVGDDVFAVAGIREPGLDSRSRTSGVYRYSLSGTPVTSTTRPAQQTGPTQPTGPVAAQPCVGAPCDVPFNLVEPPPGVTPTMRLDITLDPWHVDITTSGLGPPSAWIRAGSVSAATGATRYGVFLSESDDNPQGGLLCVLDADGACSTNTIPRAGASYSRMTVLAITDSDELPSPAEGVNRLVVTKSFDPLLTPVRGKK